MAITTIEIDRQAILHNVNYFKRIAPKSEIAAIIKANAYSHGKQGIASLLQDKVDYFGVARLSEAIELREIGIQTPIILLEGFFSHDNIDLLVEHNLQTVVHTDEQIERLKGLSGVDKLTVWIKIDTGMHRLGFHPKEAKTKFSELASCLAIRKPIHVISHFSSADECHSPQTLNQMALFVEFINSLDTPSLVGKCSIAASGGLLAWPQSHRDVVRPGIALYGVSPFDFNVPELKPAMTFKSELIAIRTHKKGESVGYGQIWTSQTDTLLGVVAMGYGDGYPRDIPPNTPVLINGRRCPIVGRVSMDMIVVDLGLSSQEKLGDEVIFWGNGLAIEEVAKYTGISAYELLTRLTSRAQIRYIN